MHVCMRLAAYFLLILIIVVLGGFVQAQKRNINSIVVIAFLCAHGELGMHSCDTSSSLK